MEKRQKRVFSEEFKANAVKLVKGGKSLADVARDLDVVPSVLGTWLKRAEAEADKSGNGPLNSAERAELGALRKQVKTLELEKAFLKKAAAFFAKENP